MNAKDRHVLALAVHVEAVDADTSVLDQIERDPTAVVGSIDALAARRRRHPKTREHIIDVLRHHLPRSIADLSI